MKALFKYFKGYGKECVLGPLFKLLEASFELLIPLVVVQIIDVGIAEGDRVYIVKMCLIMVALGIIGLVCSLTAQFFSAKAAVGFSARVKQALFHHIQGLSYSEIDTIGTSTMVTRMTSDINQLQSGVNLTLRLFLRSPFIVFGAMIMAFTINVKAAVVFVVVIPLLSVVVYGIMLLTIPMYRKVQNALDQVLSRTRANLTGVRVIRAFSKEEEEISRFEKANHELVGIQTAVGSISALMNPLTFAIINTGIIWLVYRGAVQVDQGIITQGEVVALVNYMSQILIELIKLANLIITVTKAVACAGRISGVLQIQSSMTEGTYDGGNGRVVNDGCAVEFADVSVRYCNASEDSLQGITLEVKKGSVIGIIGGTGSGKTTLVNLIPRFYDVTKGTVRVDGVDVKEYRYQTLRDKIGIVPQKSVLFTGTIRSNMQWGKKDATDEEIMKALEIAQAKEFVLQKDGGLDAEVAQGGKNFSGGQRQRLAIARAIVKHPKILILDDSASALDYATDAALRKAIREMEDPPTLFIVSQRTASMMHADQILVLEDGEAAGLGTHEELLKTCEVYKEIYDSQFKKEAKGGVANA